jgi:hypothetical protein
VAESSPSEPSAAVATTLASRKVEPSSPPSFWFIFDWKLVVSLVLLGLIAVMSCDILNNRLDRYSERHSGAVPDPATWTPGAQAEVDITLITKDEGRLDCSDDRELEGVHCGYKKDRATWLTKEGAPIDDNKANVLQPYRTAVGNHLLVVAGLWATPALAMRHHQESPRGVPEADLKRFVARCKLRFLGSWENLDMRWGTAAKWYPEKKAPLARAEWCEVVKGE